MTGTFDWWGLQPKHSSDMTQHDCISAANRRHEKLRQDLLFPEDHCVVQREINRRSATRRIRNKNKLLGLEKTCDFLVAPCKPKKMLKLWDDEVQEGFYQMEGSAQAMGEDQLCF